MRKLTFRMEGMSCPNCAMRLEGIEDDLPGVSRVEASYQKGRMVIDFDEIMVGAEEILAAVKKAGYFAEVQE